MDNPVMDATMDDPTTAQLMEGVNEARILLGSHEHRQDLAEIARISNDLIALELRRRQLQESIGERNQVYLNAEEALGAHLMTKHRVVASQPQAPASDDPGASGEVVPVRQRGRHDDHHASNCAVFFQEACDCQ